MLEYNNTMRSLSEHTSIYELKSGFDALIMMMMMISNLFVQKQRKTWESPNVIYTVAIVSFSMITRKEMV